MTDETSYQRGLELAEAGRYQEALACIQDHLLKVPDDAQALNDIGAILHCLGRSKEAIDHLVRAKTLRGNCAEIVWNLAEAYLAEGEAKETAQLFDEMERIDILNIDVLNRTANVFLNQNNMADAIELLHRSLMLMPEQEILKPIIEVIRSKRPKVAFFCKAGQEQKSLADLFEFIETRFPVRHFERDYQSLISVVDGHLREPDEVYELMKSCDISWFEMCGELVVNVSKLPKVCKNIVRVYNRDLSEIWIRKVQWDNIDVVIVVGDSSVKDALLRHAPGIESRTQVIAIQDGVNLDKFKFIDRRRGKNIACVDGLSVYKNPMFVLQCMQKLHYIDPDSRLFFAGNFENKVLEDYLRHMVYTLGLMDVVFFDSWQEDMNSWLQDKHFIFCCSVVENRAIGLLEGMACGLKPAVHNFPGAELIFPREFLFNISEEFCEQILSDEYEPERYRRFVQRNYDLKDKLNQVNSILIQLESELQLQQTTSSLCSGT